MLGFQYFLVMAGSTLGDGYSEPPYYPKEVQGRQGAVAAEATVCSQIGVDLLKKGGSAVDAVVGAALCQGIVYPFASGIGGGGFMVLKRIESEEATFIDFRETAPGGSTREMYRNRSSVLGGLSVAIPGELRGLEKAHRLYGILPWSEVVAPAIKLCDGHAVTHQLALRLGRKKESVLGSKGLSLEYLKDDDLVKEGFILTHPNLKSTLQKVAEKGADAFYTGEIAKKLVKTIQEDGGILTEQDLANYQPKVTAALKGRVLNRTMYFPPPPSSGAVTYHILKLMENQSNAKEFSPKYAHHLAESFKLAYAGRSLLGDPAFTPVEREMAYLTNPANIKDQLALIDESRTFEPSHYFQNIAPELNTVTHGTSHISAIDSFGLAVSMTATINLEFGSKLLCLDTGVLLNNEMDDFSSPGAPNYFGLAPSKSNFIQPGKRPFSSMTPIILEGDTDLFIAGSAGGSRIPTSTAQTILNFILLKHDLPRSVALGRLHHQLVPNEIRVEATGFQPCLLDSLRSKNHTITSFQIPESIVNIIHGRRRPKKCWERHPWRFSAVTDPRKNGTAAAY